MDSYVVMVMLMVMKENCGILLDEPQWITKCAQFKFGSSVMTCMAELPPTPPQAEPSCNQGCVWI